MRSKIRRRLLFYFAGTLLLFSMALGMVFFLLFSRHTMNVHKQQLQNRAEHIARSLTDFWQGGAAPMQNRGFAGQTIGYGAYLRFVDDIAMTDVWIVDRNSQQVTRSRGPIQLGYKDLPEGAEQVIQRAMGGQTTFSQVFGAVLGTPSVTVATPVVFGGEVVGAILLHENIEDIKGSTQSGLVILLVSMGGAVIVSFVASDILSRRFTRPLGRMRSTAALISAGDYTAKTGIRQDDEIGQLALTLDEMSDRLLAASKQSEKLEQLRRDFIANISHELRTPVTVLRGSLEALCDGVVSGQQMTDDYHRRMLAESLYLERLVGDLLDLGRLQNADFAIEMADIDLAFVAGDAVSSMVRMAEKKNLAIEMSGFDKRVKVRGDYYRLRQLLLILLDNAIKFSPSESDVTVELVLDGEHAVVCVADEGSGIDERDLPHIFERFYRPDSHQNKGGTGLGLAIARQIARRHETDITVQSFPGLGTKFCLKLKTAAPS
jgi:signal transduction histidine kinase